MCGRYSLFAPSEDIEQRFGATFSESFEPRYNAAPRQSLPVIPDTAPETIEPMEWGFVPPWADDRSDFDFINARVETLAEKPTFREAFAGSGDDRRVGRCLVPADGFYECVSTYTIVTTEPNDLVGDLHDRMSVLLREEDERRWLRGGPEEVADLLAPCPAEEMRAYPVSQAVNDPSNDAPEVVERVETNGGPV